MAVSSFLKYPYLNGAATFDVMQAGSISQEDELVEVTDSFDQPLLLVPRSLALRRRLSRRIVQVCLKDARGRIFLQKRSPSLHRQPGLWDISVTDEVFAGEATEGAALRALQNALGIVVPRLRLLSALPYTDAYGARLNASCYVAGPVRTHPQPDPTRVSDGMFVDEDELRGLMSQQPELLTFELVWAVRSGWLFH